MLEWEGRMLLATPWVSLAEDLQPCTLQESKQLRPKTRVGRMNILACSCTNFCTRNLGRVSVVCEIA